MTDYFALLSEPRRPWLEPEALKQKFVSLSSTLHPDRIHAASEPERQQAQERYTELNAAYQGLREPKERLRHLIELERGARPDQVQKIPPDLMNLSLEVGQACRQADALLAEKAKTSSPLLQVNLFERAQEQTERLRGFQQQLENGRQALINRLQELDREWTLESNPGSANRSTVLDRLEELYRLLSYQDRWAAQVRERVVQLSF